MSVESDAAERVEELVDELHRLGFSPGPVRRMNYHFESEIRSADEKANVLVYFGKKGVKTVVQGNPKTELYKAIVETTATTSLFGEESDEPSEYIGADESGKGDFFGPLVAAAFSCDADTRARLAALGVRDSKSLPDGAVKKIARDITAIDGAESEIVLISPAKYNELYVKFGNLNKLLAWAHGKAIGAVLERKPFATVVVDRFAKNDGLIENALGDAASGRTITQTPHAERYLGVAAASILARAAFLRRLERAEKETGHKLPKGASGAVDRAAREIVKKEGRKKLDELAKKHFKNYQRV